MDERDFLRIRENVPLAALTTMGVGGPARFFASIENEAQLVRAEAFRKERRLPRRSLFALGGGSNIVVSDAGFDGLVLRIALSGIEPDADSAARRAPARLPERVSAGAGVAWDDFVRYCVVRNLAGVEALSGIPGTVGGAPVQNIGAYGQEVGEVVASVRAWDLAQEKVVELRRDQCEFGYRSSVFNALQTETRYIVLRVTFELQPEGKPALRYEELRRRFAGRTDPSLQEVRDAILEIRKSKGMVISPEDPDSKSAGSFFKNPVVTRSDFAKLLQNARSRGVIAPGEDIPHFDAPEGKYKLSAAWLIEHAGFPRGYARGRAGISGRHALALVNRGGATAKEIVSLMESVRGGVEETFAIRLCPEPVFVGFD